MVLEHVQRGLTRGARPIIAVAAAGLILTACATGAGGSSEPGAQSAEAGGAASPTPSPPAELPRGGRTVFPEYRLVGYSGIKGDVNEDLGRLTGDLDKRCKQITKLGRKYRDGRKVLPVFEFIPVIVHATAGEDGKFRSQAPFSDVKEYLRAARRCKGLLLLNIQPGRSEFIPEMKHYERFLTEPDVGVALDPEWAIDPGEIPGRSLGRTTGAELNRSAKYLARLVREHDLPEKVMVFHQFNLGAVEKLGGLKAHDGVAIVRSVDGLGGPHIKKEEYDLLTEDLPAWIHPGFKLFYKEDVHSAWGSRLMRPKEVLALKPQPEYILYE